MSSDSSKKLPLVKVSLFGPTGSGKTAFVKTLLGKPATNLKPTMNAGSVEIVRTFYKTTNMRKIPIETYRLQIIDLPGRENVENIRLLTLAKSTGTILFYDATDPESARKLRKMVEDEIIGGGFIPNTLGFVLLGTKRDLGANKDAIAIAKTIENALNQQIREIWNYNLPHLLINALNREEIEVVLNILESLLMSLSLPPELVQKLHVDNVVSERVSIPSLTEEMPPIEKTVVPKERIEPKKEEPIAPPPEPRKETEVPKREETPLIAVPTTARPVKPSYELFPVEKIWQILNDLGRSFDEIESLLLIRRISGESVYVAFYPGERKNENIPVDLVELVLNAEKSINELISVEDIGDLSHFVMYGTKKSIIILRKKAGILAAKIRGKPSAELLELLVK